MRTLSNFGLCCGTLANADFRTLAESTSAAGFATISLWPSLFDATLESGLSESEMRSILADNELVVSELDPFCLWQPPSPDSEELAARFYAYHESDFFRIADALGGRTLNVIHAGTESDSGSDSERVDALGSLCEQAREHELLVSLEFMPWSPIGNLSRALAIIDAVGRTDCGVNIDTWHHFRSGGTIAELAELDADKVTAIQLNDVAPEPWDDPLEETALGRLLPGEGCSDSAAVLAAFDRAGIRVPINLEVFSSTLQALPPREVAMKAAESIRALLA